MNAPFLRSLLLLIPVLSVLGCASLFPSAKSSSDQHIQASAQAPDAIPIPIRGIWVLPVTQQSFPKNPGLFANLAEQGFNTVYLQIKNDRGELVGRYTGGSPTYNQLTEAALEAGLYPITVWPVLWGAQIELPSTEGSAPLSEEELFKQNLVVSPTPEFWKKEQEEFSTFLFLHDGIVREVLFTHTTISSSEELSRPELQELIKLSSVPVGISPVSVGVSEPMAQQITLKGFLGSQYLYLSPLFLNSVEEVAFAALHQSDPASLTAPTLEELLQSLNAQESTEGQVFPILSGVSFPSLDSSVPVSNQANRLQNALQLAEGISGGWVLLDSAVLPLLPELSLQKTTPTPP
jgi:hypothetical protein